MANVNEHLSLFTPLRKRGVKEEPPSGRLATLVPDVSGDDALMNIKRSEPKQGR